jgi:hypothetical protein
MGEIWLMACGWLLSFDDKEKQQMTAVVVIAIASFQGVCTAHQ